MRCPDARAAHFFVLTPSSDGAKSLQRRGVLESLLFRELALSEGDSFPPLGVLDHCSGVGMGSMLPSCRKGVSLLFFSRGPMGFAGSSEGRVYSSLGGVLAITPKGMGRVDCIVWGRVKRSPNENDIEKSAPDRRYPAGDRVHYLRGTGHDGALGSL